MQYKENSDITEVKTGTIAHGVNCQMRMGSGVAKALYKKWPIVKESYLNMKKPELGQVQIFWVDWGSKLAVANCFTQEFYGSDGGVYADLDAIRKCLTIVATYHKEIHVPMIGCGLGGLEVDDVIKIIKEVEEDKGAEFTLHVL